MQDEFNKLKQQLEKDQDVRSALLGSLLLFTQTFYKIRTGRDFFISRPLGRESHFITICRELTKVFRGETDLLVINVPPRYGKTELLIHFAAWTIAHFPDSNFLYLSFSHSLSSKQTSIVREIINLKEFKELFLTDIKYSSSAKSDFETIQGGSVYGSGFKGTITGRGAGILLAKAFRGCIIIDDAHKPEEILGNVREKVINTYYETIRSRRNDGERTPIIFIGQRLHEDDLPARLIKDIKESKDPRKVLVSLPGLDAVENALYPEKDSKEFLLKEREINSYVFAAQIQQNPEPAGGGMYKEIWFPILEEEPEIIFTFITVDTAETEEDYNDATAFSLWGVYKIKHGEFDTGLYGLHWLNCWEIRVDPRYLEDEFTQFYAAALQRPEKPFVASIEKKSTGTTLGSVMEGKQGLRIIKLDKNKASGSKVTRFLSIQKYIASKYVSLPFGAKHTKMCIDHCKKITPNNSHRFDDICDTMCDAVKLTLVDKTLIKMYGDEGSKSRSETTKQMAARNTRLQNLRRARKW